MKQNRNPFAFDLRKPKYAKRIVQPKKGKGSYNRHDTRRRPDDS